MEPTLVLGLEPMLVLGIAVGTFVSCVVAVFCGRSLYCFPAGLLGPIGWLLVLLLRHIQLTERTQELLVADLERRRMRDVREWEARRREAWVQRRASQSRRLTDRRSG